MAVAKPLVAQSAPVTENRTSAEEGLANIVVDATLASILLDDRRKMPLRQNSSTRDFCADFAQWLLSR
jgi:hypothetical protein